MEGRGGVCRKGGGCGEKGRGVEGRGEERMKVGVEEGGGAHPGVDSLVTLASEGAGIQPIPLPQRHRRI